MGSVDRKMRLLKNIARLRRAQQHAPKDKDIATVRAELELELGETVSGRLAARLLGVSHTALARWTKAGDLPLVYSVDGRLQLPVPALLDLYEKVAKEREQGQRKSHFLEPALIEGRDRAQRMRTGDLVPEAFGAANGHSRAERRGLAYHRVIAKRLTQAMADEARHRVWKWQDQGKIDPRYAAEWEAILRRPVAEVRRVIGEDSPHGRDLRQNSPFAGMLSEPERRRILDAVG